ncbi:16S rRNA (cytosine(1402)-N(4))-methyltransferase RsmH [Tuberibacillus sp. Marseille-P3662]|uniref:16S rRNA (cytosine(1402)-N(4))-methyltransferase RsmH n=1 Tax=Tuberibacillus sp. Marseille-P3662 TaxID=1965358 RepID=UPI000A1CBBAB|nr:16S rRNA (cytosine(1402)-N(4))-methyltransferase RsmH [Tuberibacillus sp. Marseille-P3662]
MTQHISVLKEEVIKQLDIQPDGRYVDCTLGMGGHSEAILERLTGGHLYAFDQDEYALSQARNRLSAYSSKVTYIPENFQHLKQELHRLEVDEVDGILFDLGVSSPQFDVAERGFSYRFTGPLDMRMDQEQALTAEVIVNEWPFEKLVSIISRYGEEKFAKSIARHIEKNREKQAIKTTTELVDIIKAAIPAAARRTGGHPAKRVFQALRIAVNDELRVFEASLKQAIELLSVGGRIAVITFHSLEDRICKQTLKGFSEPPDLPRGLPVIPEAYQPSLKLVNRKPVVPADSEMANNRRAHSAKLRIAEKIRPINREENER